MTLGRGEQEFFRRNTTRQALMRVTNSNTLIIFCGAGATIDYTGLGWGALITRLIDMAGPTSPNGEEAQRLLTEYSPLELTSILHEKIIRETGDETRARAMLTDRMRDVLYPPGRWEAGRLAAAISRLAFKLLRGGKRVIVITTNQDTYVESALEKYLENLRDDFNDASGVSVSRQVLEDSVLEVGKPKPRQLEMVYLHGRIPDHGAGEPQGYIPNGEADFTRRNDLVSGTLKEYLSIPDVNLLTIGTSLRDPPMVTALVETLLPGSIDRRFALDVMPFENLGVDNESDLRRMSAALRARGRHLGIQVLYADFYFQIAQFCEESLIRVDSEKVSSYGQRLDNWRERWRLSEWANDAQKAHDRLREVLVSARMELDQLDDAIHPADAEPLRIELWRREPRSRTIVVHAHSCKTAQ